MLLHLANLVLSKLLRGGARDERRPQELAMLGRARFARAQAEQSAKACLFARSDVDRHLEVMCQGNK